MEATKYYTYSDDLKMNAFLSIPKILFSDERYKKLNVTSKLIYSLFLNRYISTTYKDNQGPYIIFSDKELQEKLGIGRATCVRARNELRDCNLISFTKSVSYNKIYLYSFFKENEHEKTHFYVEQDLEGYKFYRFPIELFEEKYSNLPLTAKLVYAVYLDTLCLSQANYFVDSAERIYFQESYTTQIKKLNFTNPTIKEARNLLQITGLLLEYKKFSEDIRYYLLKLTHYTDRVKEYKGLSKEAQKLFIKEITEKDKNELIITPQKIGVNLKKKRQNANLTQKQVIEYLNTKYNYKILQTTYSKYERGKIHIPKDIYDKVILLFENMPYDKENDTPKEMNSPLSEKNETIEVQEIKEMKHDIPVLEKSETIEIKDMKQSKLKNRDNLNENNDAYITHTESNNIEINNTDYSLLINLINEINNSINNSLYFDKNDKDFIIACFDKLKVFKKFYMSKNEHMIQGNELIDYLNKLSNPINTETVCQTVIDKINTSNYGFKTPDNQINCFLTFLFNELKTFEEKPSWFKGQSKFLTELKRQSQQSSIPDVDENVKNYKWWE